MGNPQSRLVLLLIIASLAVQILFDPLAAPVSLVMDKLYPLDLAAARVRWQKAGIVHYQIDVRGHGLNLCTRLGVRLSVREDKVVQTEGLDPGWPLPDASGKMADSLCNPQLHTVEAVFTRVERSLHSPRLGDVQLLFEFDPLYGYVRSTYDGYMGSRALFGPAIGDCCSGFEYSNFKILP